ncbi:hypothetical protein ABIA24_005004 [Sinorhizobium fredii]
MAHREKQPQSDEKRKEMDTAAPGRFDPWEAAFNRDFQRNDREFEF